MQVPLRCRLALEIFKHRKEILADIEHIEVISDYSEYGGDGEARYNQSNYSAPELKKIYDEIAENLKKLPSEVTDTDFDRYVGDKTSHCEVEYSFEKVDGRGRSKQTSKFYLD